jgi:hypothetical protein
VTTRTAAALAATGALAAAPATAQAAPRIALATTCVVSGQPVAVTGSGFGTDSQVALSGGLAGSVTADALGGFRMTADAPVNTAFAPKRYSVAAANVADPGVAAPAVAFAVVREKLLGNYAQAITGPPHQRTTWRFAGFAAGRPIYGHFRYRRRTYRDQRFGTARGLCGTLRARAQRVPVDVLRSGVWTLQIDQARRFRTATQPRRVIRFRISRR